MFGIGMPEMILILAVALIVIGPKKLPDLAKSLGKAMREFKNATAGIKDSLNVDDDLNDIKKNLRKTEPATPPEKDKAGELKPETGLTPKGIPDPYPESDTENDNGPPTTTETDSDEDKILFTAHLEELRSRLIVASIAVAIGFFLSYAFKEKLFDILSLPLIEVMGKGEKLVFLSLPEAFFTYLKVSFLSGIMLATPVILYEFWMFVAPGLYKKERKLLLPIIVLSSLFFIGGALFCFFFVFPVGFKYFLGFASETIQPLPSMTEYFSLSAQLLLVFGLVFELPLIVICLARLGLVSVDFLKKNRKYSILIIFIIAAILTPSPDAVSQIMMAIPLMILYEISIVGAKLFGRKKGGEEEDPGETA